MPERNYTAAHASDGFDQPARRAPLADWRRLAARLWPFAQPCQRTARGRETRAWAGRLEEEKSALVAFVGNMETEFLATGEGLMRLAQQLSGIQTECQTLTDLTLGQGQEPAVQFAFQLLKKAEDLVLASYDQYDHVFVTFGELQQRLAQLPKQHAGLMRVLLPLNFITIAFRIEASRHPGEVQEVFFTLAANVNRMVDEVRVAMTQQFEEIAASERMARSLKDRVFTSIQQQRTQARSTLETSRSQLLALNAALSGAGAGAANLAQLNQAVTRHIGVIVMAQQCQDITRQKLDHVGEAMDEMREHLDDAGAPKARGEADPRHFVGGAGAIQLRQVQTVFDELDRAADSLQSGIQSLRTDAGAAAGVAVKVGAATLDAKVARQCQASIGEILAIINQAVQNIADILAAFEPLQASFVNCTNQATELAIDLQHVALNAQIFAIQSADGAPLEVLAGRMHGISDETIQQVAELGDPLLKTVELVDDLRQRLTDFQLLCQAEQGVLADESALSQRKLADLEGAIPRLIGRITRQQETFAQAAEEVLASVHFPALAAEVGARAIGFFRDLVEWGGDSEPGGDAKSAASRKIDRLASKYTMESERQTHAAALRPIAAAATATEALPSVELFGEAGQPTSAVAGPRGESASSVLSAPLAPAHSAAGAELGDNVELF